ncbi:MAG: hypothetical protein JW882_00240 [Deltaproteobacteria bacterium]|nr:hypothetical protein [Deltaproteobacteria bacterium]
MLSIPIILKEKNGIERTKETVSIGIPFPKGKIRDHKLLHLFDDTGNDVFFSGTPVSYWFDNSIKWLLLDCFIAIGANQQKIFILKSLNKPRGNPPIKSPSIVQNHDSFIIKTGGLEFILDRNHFLTFKKVLSCEKKIILDGSKLLLFDMEGREWFPVVTGSLLEYSSPLRSVLYFEGSFSSKHKNPGDKPLKFSSRITFWAEHSTASVELTIHNPRAAKHPGGLWDLGDEGSIYFKELRLECFMAPEQKYKTIYTPETHSSPLTGKDVRIYQDSSGGKNWKSRNHLNSRQEIKTTYQGYRIHESGRYSGQGLRAEPVVSLTNEGATITAAFKDFWQNFPTSIETQENGIIISFFPGEYADCYELQGGEQKTQNIYLDFSKDAGHFNGMAACHHPLVAHATPEWYCRSNVFPYLIPKEDIAETFPYEQCYELAETAIHGNNTFFDRREIIDEYGWRNYGDIYADHENLLYPGQEPIISHYNNQYDLINSFLRQFVRSGEQDWYLLADQLARHVIDIDIYHTDRDRSEYNNGLFWHTDHFCDAATSSHRGYSKQTMISKNLAEYGGGHSCQHVYTTGLLNYYYLTGDPKAKKAVLDLASFVICNINGPEESAGIIKKIIKDTLHWARNNKSPVVEAFQLLEGPGRASGNALSVLLDAFMLTRSRRYLDKAEFLIRSCVHPSDEIADKHLNDPNMRWPYTVFLQSLGKYIDIKIECDEYDAMYSYAFKSLLHYSEWMMENEFPFLDRKELLDFPNYATRAATDIRKACVLLIASRHCDPSIRKQYNEKATSFFHRSIKDILALDTKSEARPLAILMQNMDVPLHHAVAPPIISSVRSANEDFGIPENKASLLHLIKNNSRLVVKLLASFFRTHRVVNNIIKA